jgi:thiol-disulfide isomerase/thioredoxin
MKKFWPIFALFCLVIMGAACTTPEPPLAAVEEEAEEPLFDLPVKDGHYIIEDAQLGLTLGIPMRQMEDYTIYYERLTLLDGPKDTPPLGGMQVFYYPPGLLEEIVGILRDNSDEETMAEVAEMIDTRSRLLYSIQYYSVWQWDSWIGGGKTMANITGNAENRELGRQNGRVYVYTEYAPRVQGLSEEELPAYREALAAIPAMRAHAALLEQTSPPVENKKALPAFSARDIYGTAVDSSIFADYDLTMLNIWGTFCGPCIAEMPDLGKMATALPAGTQIVGLVGDALNEENIALAQTIAEETAAAYPHIVPDKALYDYLNREIAFYPTTLFIDNQGNLVGEPLIGAMSRAQYEEILEKRLQMLL